MCDRSIVLHGGKVRYDGDTVGAISLYHELLGEPGDVDDELTTPAGIRIDVAARMTGFRLLGADGRPTVQFVGGEETIAQVDVVFDREVVDPIIGFSVANESGIAAYANHARVNGAGRTYHVGERATFEARATMHLTTGSYTAGMSLAAGDTMLPAAVPPRRVPFFVANSSPAKGVADLGAVFGEASGTDGSTT
jgi:hypothetical protein